MTVRLRLTVTPVYTSPKASSASFMSTAGSTASPWMGSFRTFPPRTSTSSLVCTCSSGHGSECCLQQLWGAWDEYGCLQGLALKRRLRHQHWSGAWHTRMQGLDIEAQLLVTCCDCRHAQLQVILDGISMQPSSLCRSQRLTSKATRSQPGHSQGTRWIAGGALA